MRGRKSSDKMKLLTGRKRHVKDKEEARPIATFPEPPDHLGEQAKTLWKKLGPLLAATKILNALDLLTFEELCCCYQEMREAELKIQEEGAVIADKREASKPILGSGSGTTPAATFLKLCASFGMNPDARGKLNWSPVPDDFEGEDSWPRSAKENHWRYLDGNPKARKG